MDKMDSCSKLVLVLALIYVLLVNEASKRVSAQSESAQLDESAGPLPDRELQRGGAAPDELRRQRPGNPKLRQRAQEKRGRKKPASVGDELEAQAFLLELLNITESRLGELDADERSKLKACSRFNESLGKSQDQLAELLELTSLARAYQLSKPAAQQAFQLSSHAAKQAAASRRSLAKSVSLYFECLSNAELGSNELLRADLLPLSPFMRQLDRSLAGGLTSAPADGPAFARLLPDAHALDRLRDELERHAHEHESGFIQKLSLVLDGLKRELADLAIETQNLLGLGVSSDESEGQVGPEEEFLEAKMEKKLERNELMRN